MAHVKLKIYSHSISANLNVICSKSLFSEQCVTVIYSLTEIETETENITYSLTETKTKIIYKTKMK